MKLRLVTALAIVGALLLGVSAAEAKTPVLDGKKVKVLKVVGQGGLQDHDQDFFTLGGPERVDCVPPRCLKMPFVYQPAKGIKGDLMLTATWSNPLSDMDLYLAEVGKRGVLTEIATCGGSAGTTEKVFVDRGLLHSGHSYQLIVDYYRSLNETVHAQVEINVPSTISNTLPTAVDDQAHANCIH